MALRGILAFSLCFFLAAWSLSGQMTPCSQIGVNCTPYACSVICNPEACHVTGAGGELSVLQVAGWGRTYQSPDCYPFPNGIYPFPAGNRDVSAWSHGLSPNPNGEGFAADAAVLAGEAYLLAFWFRTLPKITTNQAPYLGAMFARLVEFNQASYPPSIPQANQIVFSDSLMVFHPDTFWQAVSCFRAIQSYDAVWFYPLQDMGLEQASIGVTQAEMIPLAFSAGQDVNSSPGQAVTIGDSAACSVYGAVWEWREMGQSTVLGNSNTITVSPTSTTTYVLTRTFPLARWQRDYIGSQPSCATSDTVTIFVEGVGTNNVATAEGWQLPSVISSDGISFANEFKVLGNKSTLVGGSFEIQVFDLNGSSVFFSDNPAFRWSCDASSPGLYTYRIISKVQSPFPKVFTGKFLVLP